MRCLNRVLIGLTAVLTPQVIHAQTPAAQIYVLDDQTLFQRGCFPPCMCPIMEARSIRGTFELTKRGCDDGLFECYTVSHVNWDVHLGGETVHVTGQGVYRLGGEVAVEQQLDLDLRIGDEEPQHFSSGIIAGGSSFPRIDIAISIHNFYCFDTGITIAAAPAPEDQILTYQARGSYEGDYQEACGSPAVAQPLVGSFKLVKLDKRSEYTEYALTRLHVEEMPDQSPNPLVIAGAGMYRVYQDGRDQMSLDLRVSALEGKLWRFTSSLRVARRPFPAIDVILRNFAASSDRCPKQRVDIHADPVGAGDQ